MATITNPDTSVPAGKNISPVQQEAIRHGAGPCAVIAGPGSGKTFVLVERIRHLIESRTARPGEILVLTFSRAAAAEMRERFLRVAGRDPERSAVVFGTFHAVFYRILQDSSAEKLRLVDADTKQGYLRHLCGRRTPRGVTPQELQHLFSRSKNGLPCREEWLPALVREYDLYLQNRGCLDFDDMIARCLALLQSSSSLLEQWRARFRWILVDEFQDVSPMQYEALRLLAAPGNNLFAVGDDDQSIYGFRGAEPGIFRRFLEDYAGEVHRIQMTTNYRCGRRILHASSLLIRDNKNRIKKNLQSGSGETGSCTFRFFTDRDRQYAFIAEDLQTGTEGKAGESAVIFRTHSGAGAFLPVLQRYGIPFRADATIRRICADAPENRFLRDICAYYRAARELAGPGARREDLLRIMNRPERFLSGSFLQGEKMCAADLLQNAGPDREAVLEFIRDLQMLDTLSPPYSFRYLLDSIGYRDYLKKNRKSVAADYRRAESEVPETKAGDFLETLTEKALELRDSGQWRDYLEERLAAGMTETRSPRKPQSPPDPAFRSGGGQDAHRQDARGRIHILTMHACKGLEFDTVYLPDLNEGNIPSRRAQSPEQIEEERRLLYVAMTRARHALILTCLEGTPDRPAAPSRFLHAFFRSHI